MTISPSAHQSPPKLFYGWKVVWAIMFILTFTSGLSFYNHAVILDALASLPSFSVGSASIAVSIFFLSGGITGLWVAKAIGRYDIRSCMTFGSIVSGISLSALAFVESAFQLFAVYVLFGVGFSASSLIPATTLVSRWFRRRRAVALSIASTGLSLGGVLITPLCALMVEHFGLSRSAPLMGLMYLVGTIPFVWIFLRPSPESMGLSMDGIDDETAAELGADHSSPEAKPSPAKPSTVKKATAKKATSNAAAMADGISFTDARNTRFFWGLSLAYIFLMMAQVGGIAHQVGLARESLSQNQVVLALGILPVASIIGRLVGGWLVEQIAIRSFSIAMMLLQVGALAVLSLDLGAAGLCIGLALFGVTVGNLLMLQPLLVAEAFGLRDYPRIYAVSNLMSSWGTAAGPAVLGAAYFFSQNTYSLAYGVAGACGCIGLLLFLSGGRLEKVRG